MSTRSQVFEKADVWSEALPDVEVHARDDRAVPCMETKRVVFDDVGHVDVLDRGPAQQPNRPFA